MSVLVAGGAGFVGSSFGISFADRHCWEIVAINNLGRRGSDYAKQ